MHNRAADTTSRLYNTVLTSQYSVLSTYSIKIIGTDNSYNKRMAVHFHWTLIYYYYTLGKTTEELRNTKI